MKLFNDHFSFGFTLFASGITAPAKYFIPDCSTGSRYNICGCNPGIYKLLQGLNPVAYALL